MALIFRDKLVFVTIRKRNCAQWLTDEVREYLIYHSGAYKECYLLMCDAL